MHLQKMITVGMVVITPVMIGLYTEKREDIIKLYAGRIVPQIVFFLSCVYIVFIALLPLIIPLIFGKEFTGSILSAQILIMGLVYHSFIALYYGVISAYKKTKAILTINIIMIIINIVGDLILIPILGIEGAAISSALCFSVGGICYMSYMNMHLGVRSINSLFMLIPVLLTFIAVEYKSPVILLCLILTYYLLLKKGKLFRQGDADFLRHISIPSRIKSVIFRIYGILCGST